MSGEMRHGDQMNGQAYNQRKLNQVGRHLPIYGLDGLVVWPNLAVRKQCSHQGITALRAYVKPLARTGCLISCVLRRNYQSIIFAITALLSTCLGRVPPGPPPSRTVRPEIILTLLAKFGWQETPSYIFNDQDVHPRVT